MSSASRLSNAKNYIPQRYETGEKGNNNVKASTRDSVDTVEKEIKEIQEMLDEIKNPPKNSIPTKITNCEVQTKNVENTSKPECSKNQFKRSKTETETEIFRTTTKLKSIANTQNSTNDAPAAIKANGSHFHRLQSSQITTVNALISPKKSHNSAETRRYMEEQRKKRCSLSQTRKANDINGEQIKKRLEELRKTTRRIVEKNVTKAKTKKYSTNENNGEIVRMDNAREDPKIKSNQEKKVVNMEDKKTNKPTNPKLNIPFSKDFLPSGYVETQSVSSQRLASVQNVAKCGNPMLGLPSTSSIDTKRSDSNEKLSTPNLIANPLTENMKKIGLLRKPESQDHSYSAIKDFDINKENVIEMLTPQLNGFFDLSSKETDILENSPLPQPAIGCETKPESIGQNSYKNMRLSVPGCKLINRFNDHCKSESSKSSEIKEQESLINRKDENNIDTTDIPYWLKPSSVQVYPYNFITAIRKKLEAITHAEKHPSKKQLKKNGKNLENSHCSDSTAKEEKEKLEKIKNNKLQVKDLTTLPGDKVIAKENSSVQHDSHQSVSEISSFSSISLEIPASEKKSGISSIQSSKITTISSSIFSSPKKKTHKSSHTIIAQNQSDQISPLSQDNIAKLQIQLKTENKPDRLANVNFQRGDNFLNAPPRGIPNEPSKEYFNQFLEDFNRSLSQAIEINHQLKTTLQKSHTIFSPKQKDTHAEDYASDFEEEITSSSNGSASTTIASSRINVSVTSSPTKRNITELEPSVFKLRKNIFAAREDGGVKPLAISSDDNESSKLSSGTSFRHKSETDYKIPSLATEKLSTSSDPIETELSVSTESTTHRSQTKQKDSSSPMSSGNSSHSKKSLKQSGGIVSRRLSPKKQQDKKSITEDVEICEEEIQSIGSNHCVPNEGSIIRKKSIKNNDNSDDRKCSSGPPSYNTITSQGKGTNRLLSDSTRNSLNQSDFESSIFSQNGTLSDSTLNYSSIGMYEKLIQNETTKSEHLTALMKLREKALLDRTKGQIAWLEVQKEKYKTKGLTYQISTIKKKQRAILLKMEKEREAIKRLLQSTGVTAGVATIAATTATTTAATTTVSTYSPSRLHQRERYNFSPAKASTTAAETTTKRFKGNCHIDLQKPELLKTKIITLTKNPIVSVPAPKIIRGYELETSPSLEQLLQKREEDLRKRREHVERLMKWHQRLDQEEAEVLQLERMLIDYNVQNVQQEETQQQQQRKKQQHHHHHRPTSSSKCCGVAEMSSDIEKSSSSVVSLKFQTFNKNTNTKQKEKMERKLREIDKSLRELNSISSASGGGICVDPTTGVTSENGDDYVRTTGNKLNKLWRRLTSENIEKFESNRHYKLCKADLERLYEEAKYAVLQDFGRDGDDRFAEFLEKSSFCSSQPSSMITSEDIVPRLNLNLSSAEQSDVDQKMISTSITIAEGNYSPSAAEEEFLGSKGDNGKSKTNATSSSLLTTSSVGNLQDDHMQYSYSSRNFQTTLDYNNLSKTTSLLQRSLSDTELSATTKQIKNLNTSPLNFSKSQRNISISNNRQSQIEKILSPAEKELLSEEIKWIEADRPVKIQTSHINNIPNDDSQKNNSDTRITISELPSSSVKIADTNEISSSIDEVSDNSNIQVSSTIPTLMPATIEKKMSPEAKSLINIDISSALSNNYLQASLIKSTSIETEIQEESLLLKWNENLENSKSYSDEIFEANSCEFSNEVSLSQVLTANSSQTIIDDMSMPLYETITDDDIEIELTSNNNGELLKKVETNNIDSSKKIPTDVVKENHPSSSVEIFLPSDNNNSNKPSTVYSVTVGVSSTYSTYSTITSQIQQFLPESPSNDLELRKCQQIMLVECEQQMKQFENVAAVPYMYVREIPNKPPPPYVPPAHGSPMTAIFPSEERIKDITYRRTRELYYEMLKTDLIDESGKKIPPVMDEKITNIYERIILDICREYLSERNEVLKKSDPTNFHSPLAFFNPPDRLRCIQEFVYKEVRRCLAMDKILPKRNQTYPIYGSRAKRDHIGKIIIQEMYEEDEKWCNFHQEESEVISLIVDEMIVNVIRDIANEIIAEVLGSIDDGNVSSLENEIEKENSPTTNPIITDRF